jgi:hypothetical protein
MNMNQMLVTTNISIQRDPQRGLVTVRPTNPSDPQWPADMASFMLADEEGVVLWQVMSAVALQMPGCDDCSI